MAIANKWASKVLAVVLAAVICAGCAPNKPKAGRPAIALTQPTPPPPAQTQAPTDEPLPEGAGLPAPTGDDRYD